jgi:hypothetical protein
LGALQVVQRAEVWNGFGTVKAAVCSGAERELEPTDDRPDTLAAFIDLSHARSFDPWPGID